MDSINHKPKTLVSADEQTKLVRAVRAWLQECPYKPVDKVDFEYIPDAGGLAMSTIEGAWKTNQYIYGGYRAQYQFCIAYATIAANTDERLQIDEALNAMGAWAETAAPPEIGEGIRVLRIVRETPAFTAGRYENNMEEHQINMTLIYEVI